MKKMKVIFALLIAICYTSNCRANDSIIEEIENINLLLLGIIIGIFFLLCGYTIYRIKRTKKRDYRSKVKLEKISKTDNNIDLKQEYSQKYFKKQSQKIENRINNFEAKIESLEIRLSNLELLCNRNPEIENSEKCKNENIEQVPITFEKLTVQDGKLVKADIGQAIYYVMWKEGNKNLFKFVNNDKTRKAINNRTIIIEPFCDIIKFSKYPDESNFIEVCTPGIVTDNFSVIKKIKIQYK